MLQLRAILISVLPHRNKTPMTPSLLLILTQVTALVNLKLVSILEDLPKALQVLSASLLQHKPITLVLDSVDHLLSKIIQLIHSVH